MHVVDKKSKRIEVLLHWREFVAARGHVVPSAADIKKIGASGEIWPGYINVEVAEPWRETIAFLLKQLQFGVVDPVSQLPDDLLDPVTTPVRGPATRSGSRRSRPHVTTSAPPVPAPSTEDPRLTALKSWRAAEVGRHTELAALKDAQLGNIVRTTSRTAVEISAHLPASLTGFAAEMARVIAAVTPAVPTRGVPDRPRRAAPPADSPTRPDPPRVSEPNLASAPPDQHREGLSALEFTRYNLISTGHPVLQVRSTPAGSSGTTLDWPPFEHAGDTVVYRVVSGDEYSPYSPDEADEIVVTGKVTCSDDRPFCSAVRHVQVWCHVGASLAQAAAAQPVLHARTSIVAPVQGPSIVEDEGKVVGYWAVLKGAAKVQVHRIPVELAERVVRRGTPDATYRIFPAQANLTGFVDGDAERGRRYLYQVWVEAEVGDGNLLSIPVAQRVDVSAVLLPVTDLTVTLRDDGEFDLSWTPPPGSEVAIYRTEQPPGATTATLPGESALRSARLPDDSRLRRPFTTAADGRSVMTEVSWPQGWTRAYFTPVTLLGGQARLGPSVPAIRIRPILDAKIVERTHQQVVTFAWPDGATSVFAYIGAAGLDVNTAKAGGSMEISRKQYVRQGGLHMVNALPAMGCSVHLVPIAYGASGEPVEGVAVTLGYPGLLRLMYHVTHQRGGTVSVRVVSEYDLAYRPAFALVHNRTRLPLAIRDGVVLPVVAGGGGAQGGARLIPPRLSQHAGDVVWTASIRDLSGYIRLFVDLGDEPPATSVALLDPPIATLRLGNGQPR